MHDDSRASFHRAPAPSMKGAALGGLLPVALLALFTLWSGTFFHGAGSAAAVVGHLALLAVAVAVGRRLRWVGWRAGTATATPAVAAIALWLALLVSWSASPVPRAGLVPLLLAPALLAVPWWVGACWRTTAAATLGTRALSVLVLALAAGSLVELVRRGDGPAAWPLGHHLLLAVALVVLFPLAVTAGGPARAGAGRSLRVAAGAAGTVAVAATGSLLGLGGLAVACWVLWRQRLGRWRWAAGGSAGAALGVWTWLGGGEGEGELASWLARRTYWRAGWEGWLERPLVGGGPGATPWRLAAHWRPRPGVNPAGEVVGDLHSLPLQALFELGLLGSAAAVWLGWRMLRPQGAGAAEHAALRRAGRAGIAGGLVVLGGGVTLGTTAPWVVLAVAGGAAMVGLDPDRSQGRGLAVPAVAYAMIAMLLLAPLEAARYAYGRARAADRDPARAWLERAVSLDPDFPLYRLRLALETRERGAERAAAEALRAAEAASAVPALWLAAGALGQRAATGWAPAALERACSLDPLAALPPMLHMLEQPQAKEAADEGARALLAEPRLAAAVAWEENPELLLEAGRQAATWPGVEEGWRAAAAQLVRQVHGSRFDPQPRSSEPDSSVRLVASFDREPATALSLHAFRRLPWRGELASTALRPRLLAAIGLPAATALPATRSEAFPRHCGRPPPAH
ncbi:MAG TPA: O-antigen ligase family protein [Thermoanaerobaculia bacterium]|nr:O-antigen ligase family protein [Thermoanaerobaculia bacterium]